MKPVIISAEIRSFHLCLISVLVLQPVYSRQCSPAYPDEFDRCMHPLYSQMEEPLLRGVPTSPEAIHKACRVFKKAMACVEEYAACLSEGKRRELVRQTAGAKNTYAFLCDDEQFKKDYLQHLPCIRGTSNDWQKCANRFQNFAAAGVQTEELTVEERELGQCCAKMGFLNCLYDKVRFMCRSDSSQFLMLVAQTMSDIEVKSSGCKNVTEAICGSCHIAASALVLTIVLVFGRLLYM